ncbi:GNAT family N-acetyltransferase [Brevibacillus sp. 179-C9.3 HS]|uniref:GNAT family N-acetyltransferase n=1 Tax=unclassified Brevibacillus TaxID=2684853 RepID=UPI0039A38702
MMQLKGYRDRDKIKSLLAECMWPDNEKIERELTQYIESDERMLLGKFTEAELVGIIGYITGANGEGVIKHIAVKSTCRGMGLGRAMISELLHNRGLSKIQAETDQEAVGFYRKAGFVVTSLGEKYPGVERFSCFFESTPLV